MDGWMIDGFIMDACMDDGWVIGECMKDEWIDIYIYVHVYMHEVWWVDKYLMDG